MEQGIDTTARVAGRDYYERCTLHLHRPIRGSAWLGLVVAYAILSTVLATRPGMNPEFLQAIVCMDAVMVGAVLGYIVKSVAEEVRE